MATKRGAPKGNLNALKSGKRSKQLKRLVIALMADPGTRKLLLALRELDRRRLQQLQDAVNQYAGLLLKPSRRRTITSVSLPENLLPDSDSAHHATRGPGDNNPSATKTWHQR